MLIRFNPKVCEASDTTTFGRGQLGAICVNKTLTGTVTIKETSTTLGTLAAGSLAGNYWFTPGDGVTFANLVVTLSGADDVTALFCSNG